MRHIAVYVRILTAANIGLTASIYCGIGLLLTLLIALHWWPALWPLEAQANTQ